MNCGCVKRGASCIPGYCACALRCLNNNTSMEPQFHDRCGVGSPKDVDVELFICDDPDGSDSEASSTAGCDGTLEDIGLDL